MAQSEVEVHELDPLRDEQAVQKALETIVQALQGDVVTRHLCREGLGERFMRTLLASYLAAEPPARVLATSDFSAAALLGETRGRQAQRSSGSPPAHGAAVAAAALPALAQRPQALEGLKQQPQLEELVARHGGALSVHFVAVAPGQQGRGLGSLLLRHVCAAADARGLPLYLEATTARSKGLYAKHGFVHVADKKLDGGGGDDGPVLAVMVRPPQAAAAAAAAAGTDA